MKLEPVLDPQDGFSDWDKGWRLTVAWIASGMIVLLGVGHLYLALEVLIWWIGIAS